MRAAAPRWRSSSTRGAAEEIIFTRNATEAINLVASSWGEPNIGAGDEIVTLDHGASFQHRALALPAGAPWRRDQMGAGRRRRQFPDRRVREAADRPRTKLVAITQMSNALGTIVPVKDVVQAGACSRHPGAGRRQPGRRASGDRRAGHRRAISTSSPATSCTARPASACSMPSTSTWSRCGPINGGGEMIREVARDWVTYGDPPHKFEAGTPAIVESIGLGAAIDYVNSIGKERIAAHEHDLLDLRPGASARNQLAAADRHRARQGTGDFLRDEGRASP